MRRYLLAVLALMVPTLIHAATVTALSGAGVTTLLKPPVHGERIIELWALDCAYCEANLQALAKLQQAHPHDIELVPVSTDDIAQRALILQRLHAAGMDGYPARAYEDATPERINYLVDPAWGGETPRTLLIRADGTRRSLSGALTPQALKAFW